MSIQSVDRAFDIIELVSCHPQGLNLSDMASSLSLPLSTVYRITADLVKKGYVLKDGRVNTYRMGPKILELTAPYLRYLEIKTEARPFLSELSDQTGFPVFLAVLLDNEVSYLDKVDSPGRAGYSVIGQKRSLFTTSLGKALLFNHSDDELDEVIREKGMTPYTLYSLTDPLEFKEDLYRCRERGWSSDNQEDRLDFRCVGVPVYAADGSIAAAVSCSWDKNFFAAVNQEDIAVRVMSCAGKISEHLLNQESGYLF